MQVVHPDTFVYYTEVGGNIYNRGFQGRNRLLYALFALANNNNKMYI